MSVLRCHEARRGLTVIEYAHAVLPTGLHRGVVFSMMPRSVKGVNCDRVVSFAAYPAGLWRGCRCGLADGSCLCLCNVSSRQPALGKCFMSTSVG